MEKKALQINGIPSVLWGNPSEKGFIAVHGNQSHKMDRPTELLAENACARGYQVVSFDLPEHGDRKQESTLCKVQNCVEELREILQYAEKNWKQIRLFANSMGAYFSLLAYAGAALDGAWFLSPVVDMQRIIQNMMGWFHVTEQQLQEQQTVPTPIGQTLYWDYYVYVQTHPVCEWGIPTHILYGSRDELCEADTISKFVRQFSCQLETVPEAEHYFHTPEQLQALNRWMQKTF